ncbi:FecR family protein [Rhodanobacter sp. DHB23]|uniref:FecR family protein n=1 Tax=Rhodanobacter sp. DHB23 TaxID=2775923 RepID=UPI00177A8913|nr:FecR family protein [Rhodanobacter sp. DHB23]MBD8872134.1 FecR domain-containing protein [Rhodanobacter sp. DHB23]
MRVLAPLLASWRPGWRPLAVLLLCAAATLAQAQSADDGDGTAPPDRVARLSYSAGDLGFLPAGSQDWAAADLNRPLATGDRLATGDGARAELELGGASLRMDGGTDFGMLNLNDNLAQVELTQGTLNLSVRNLDQGQSYEIDTPTLALVVNQPGTYRIDVDNGGNGTRVVVFDGQATVYGENNAQRDVFAGRSYQFDDPTLATLSIGDYGGGDDFDAWCSQRDQRYAQSDATRYVSADVVGYQDLDQYGNWQDSPDYGAVWYPSQVPAGWAPYRNGHWTWIAPWGWTWVDDSPWGFAPYHYGRWAYIRGAWGWIPGPRATRPVYAPALVAFVGGGGWSVSAGIGGGAPVGWFPLGPGEVYNPWYRCDRAYYQRVNTANIYVHNGMYRNTVIGNIDNQYNAYRAGRAPQGINYANRGAPRGFTAMPGAAFAGGQRVQRDMLRVDPRQLAAAPVMAAGVTALRPTPRGVAQPLNPRMRPLPTADFRRNVVARTPPPASLPSARANPAPAFGNVRVLGTQAGANRASMQPRPVPGPNANLPNARGMEPAAPPANALPSSRFVRPDTNAGGRSLPSVEPIRRASPAETQPRPGVSYISGPEQAPRPQPDYRDQRPANTLPQPPRLEPAPQRYVPAGNNNAPASMQSRQPAYQPQNQAPQRFEQPRPAYQPPSELVRPYQPQQQQRYEAPRPAAQPQHSQKHVESSDKAPPRNYEQQH